MAERYRTRLLEVSVVAHGAASWEWQVESRGDVLVCGFETTPIGVRFAGNDALFLILASGREA
jgi:hypothetical protein